MPSTELEKRFRELQRRMETQAFILLDLEQQLDDLARKLFTDYHPAHWMNQASHVLNTARRVLQEDAYKKRDREIRRQFYELNGGFCEGCGVPRFLTKEYQGYEAMGPGTEEEYGPELRDRIREVTGPESVDKWMECDQCQ